MAQTPPDIGDYGSYAGWGATALVILYFLRDKLFPFWAERRKAELAHDQRIEDVVLQQVLDSQKTLIENLIGVSKDQRKQLEDYTYRAIGQALQEEQRSERDKEFFKWVQGVDQSLAQLHRMFEAQRKSIEKIEQALLNQKSEPGIRDTQQRKVVS